MKKINYYRLLLGLLLTITLVGCNSSRTVESAGQFVDNSLITTKVKAQLFSEMSFESLEIKVKSFKDTVQLSGFVNSKAVRARAEKITWSIPGVRTVNNNLIVKSDND